MRNNEENLCKITICKLQNFFLCIMISFSFHCHTHTLRVQAACLLMKALRLYFLSQ